MILVASRFDVLFRLATPRANSPPTAARVVNLRQTLRRDPERIGEPQGPHQENGPQNAAPLPTPAGGDRLLPQANRPAATLQPTADLDILHEGNVRKTANRREC